MVSSSTFALGVQVAVVNVQQLTCNYVHPLKTFVFWNKAFIHLFIVWIVAALKGFPHILNYVLISLFVFSFRHFCYFFRQSKAQFFADGPYSGKCPSLCQVSDLLKYEDNKENKTPIPWLLIVSTVKWCMVFIIWPPVNKISKVFMWDLC